MSINEYIALMVVVIFHGTGIVMALYALLYTRTSQGAFAWILALLLIPYIAVFCYWVFGPKRFAGYVALRRSFVRKQARQFEYPTQVVQMRDCCAPQVGADRAALLDAISGLAGVPVVSCNDVSVVEDAAKAFPLINQAIKEAKKYVLIEFFIIKDDAAGHWFKDLLLGAVARGVRVHLVFDEIGSRKLPVGYLSELRSAGVNVMPFNGKRRFFTSVFRINFRNHRKIVVVDGVQAFIGGMNIGDDYLGKTEVGYWRDTLMHLRGPIVQQAQLVFLEDWRWANLNREDTDMSWLCWDAPCQVGDKTGLIVASGPADDFPTWEHTVIMLANAAKVRLWVATPYFVPNPAVITALQQASLRGVDVKLLIPRYCNHSLVRWSMWTYIEELDIYDGIEIRGYTKGFMHQKVILVDDDIASIGTANLDNRSLVLNFEINPIMIDSEIAAFVHAMLQNDMLDSQPMTAQDYRNRKFFYRILCNVARLFSPIQ